MGFCDYTKMVCTQFFIKKKYNDFEDGRFQFSRFLLDVHTVSGVFKS